MEAANEVFSCEAQFAGDLQKITLRRRTIELVGSGEDGEQRSMPKQKKSGEESRALAALHFEWYPLPPFLYFQNLAGN